MKKTFLFCGLAMFCILITTACSNGGTSEQDITIQDETNTTAVIDTTNNLSVSQNDEMVEWNEITQDGVNEELLFENLDTEILEKIASNLQDAIKEEAQEEQDNPEIIITEGWTRIFDKEQYKEVVEIGKPAMKPLYCILYKSSNNGQYEYLCAMALCEISGIGGEVSEDGTMEWSTAKEYLELFTETILAEKEEK